MQLRSGKSCPTQLVSTSRAAWNTNVMCIYIYIYRERERERERKTDTHMCVYIHMYTYIYTYIYTHTYTRRSAVRRHYYLLMSAGLDHLSSHNMLRKVWQHHLLAYESSATTQHKEDTHTHTHTHPHTHTHTHRTTMNKHLTY